MVLIERPGLSRDVIFAAKMTFAALIALCFGIVWYGLLGWAMIWGVLKVMRFFF